MILILTVMMIAIAIFINTFIAWHFRAYLKNRKLITALAIISIAFVASVELMVLGFLINACICLMIGDLIYLLLWKTKIKGHYQRRYVLIAFVCSLGLSGYGIYNADQVIITNYQVRINKDFEDKKIMALSDIHLGTAVKADELDQIISEADKVKPDVILLVGDVYDEGTSSGEIDYSMEVFEKLAKEYPVYYVIGNHEVGYGSSPLKEYNLLERLNQAGVITLNDEYVEFEDINLIGRVDYTINDRKEMKDIINGIDNDKPLVLLDHQPRFLKENKELKIDLMISGHTHAGQVWPMLPLWNLAGINEMNYGYRQDDNFNAIVSSGMGTWGFAMRTSKNCEIVIIELKSS